MRNRRKPFMFTRGANFIGVWIFGHSFTMPFFWRYEAAYAKGRDAGWLSTYSDYEPRLKTCKDENAKLKQRVAFLESSIMEVYDGELITMSRARELLGETSIIPVREMYREWKQAQEKIN